MADIGMLGDLSLVDACPDRDTWHLVLDEHTGVMAELLPSRGVLALSACLGRPVSPDRTVLNELLLRYGHAWHLTGGISASLDDAAGEFHLLMQLGAADLTASVLREHLSTFADRVRCWRYLLSRPMNGADAVPGDALLALAIGRV